MAEDRKLDPDFGKDERLFHYTSSTGLYGIIETQCLWATHFQFLNDKQEISRARQPLTETVYNAVLAHLAALKVNKKVIVHPTADLKGVSAHEAGAIVDAMYGSTLGNDRVKGLGHPFVFSAFCCAPDRIDDFANGALLHWATYGRGGGYALQVNPHVINELLQEEAKRFGGLLAASKKVEYVGSDKLPEQLQQWCDKIGVHGKKLVEANLRRELDKIDAAEALEPFVYAMCLTKDAFFAPESEARIIVLRSHEDVGEAKAHELRMRHAGSLAVPYIRLFDGINFLDRGAVERIVVGPHPDNERRVEALTGYLRSKKLSHIEVATSKVPLREV